MASPGPSSPPPLDLVPSVKAEAQTSSYTYRSPTPKGCLEGVPCVLGVDEAGRGPVLGPLVYGVAYCPLTFHDEEGSSGLKDVGFADSKALTAERRDELLVALQSQPDTLGWAIRSMAPQDISAGMLQRRPVNLNAQSTAATVSLIQGTLDAGVNLVHIYVDTVGNPDSYKKLLSSHFPKHIEWTVCSKADAIFPIVGAASIAAKTTRDAAMEGWLYAEPGCGSAAVAGEAGAEEGAWRTPEGFWETGSGYPGDPRTVAFLARTLDPVFGWPGIVRFSWATIKTLLDDKVTAKRSASSAKGQVEPQHTTTIAPLAGAKKGYAVRWTDEPVTIARFFKAPAAGVAKPSDPNEKGRSKLLRELGLNSVSSL